MTISKSEIAVLESSINSMLSIDNMSFKMSVHFVKDRMNDIRNNPMIQIAELRAIFNRLMVLHKQKIAQLKHNQSFNIKCLKSHINMPCAVSKTKSPDGSLHQENIVITVMRKENFIAKDSIEFLV
jgi:hypothetical protein